MGWGLAGVLSDVGIECFLGVAQFPLQIRSWRRYRTENDARISRISPFRIRGENTKKRCSFSPQSRQMKRKNTTDLGEAAPTPTVVRFSIIPVLIVQYSINCARACFVTRTHLRFGVCEGLLLYRTFTVCTSNEEHLITAIAH